MDHTAALVYGRRCHGACVWVVVVVVGLQESHLLWYGLELGSDPPSPLVYHRLLWGMVVDMQCECTACPPLWGKSATRTTTVEHVLAKARDLGKCTRQGNDEYPCHTTIRTSDGNCLAP